LKLRNLFFWLHLTAGSVAGVVILIMSATGVLLAFEKQIVQRAEKNVRVVAVPSGRTRLPIEELLIKVKENGGGLPSIVSWHPEANSSVELGYGRDRAVFVNPYSGAVVGEGAKGLRKFFGSVEDWHRWLGAGPEKRPAWRAVTGACNLAFFFLVCTGLYLWMPRSAAGFKAVFWFRGGLTGKARDFNWHNTIGFWCCVPLFVMVMSSVVMSYPWANNLVYRAAGSPVPPQGPPGGPAGGQRSKSGISLDGLNSLGAAAEKKIAEWNTISLRLPADSDVTAVFSIDTGNGGQPLKRSQLTLNRKTRAETKWETYGSYSRGRQWRVWMRFAHTGEVYGLAGQFIATLASLGGVFLVCTGISLALRRFFAWRERRETRVVAREAASNLIAR
jgi:uncharacterized iron-regulated membrane protein